LNIFLDNEAVVAIYLWVATWIFVFGDDNGMEDYDICWNCYIYAMKVKVMVVVVVQAVKVHLISKKRLVHYAPTNRCINKVMFAHHSQNFT
jgi:hypothetical protein